MLFRVSGLLVVRVVDRMLYDVCSCDVENQEWRTLFFTINVYIYTNRDIYIHSISSFDVIDR